MTYSDTEPRGTLRYRLLASSIRPSTSPLDDPGEWGHEYVRHLAAELGEELVLHGAVASIERILVRLRQRLKILEPSDGPLCPLLQVLDVVHLLVDDRIDSIPELFLLLRVGAVA